MAIQKTQIRNVKIQGIWEQVCEWNGWNQEMLEQFEYENVLGDYDYIEYDSNFENPRTKEHGLLELKWMSLKGRIQSNIEENESGMPECYDAISETYSDIENYIAKLEQIKV